MKVPFLYFIFACAQLSRTAEAAVTGYESTVFVTTLVTETDCSCTDTTAQSTYSATVSVPTSTPETPPSGSTSSETITASISDSTTSTTVTVDETTSKIITVTEDQTKTTWATDTITDAQPTAATDTSYLTSVVTVTVTDDQSTTLTDFIYTMTVVTATVTVTDSGPTTRTSSITGTLPTTSASSSIAGGQPTIPPGPVETQSQSSSTMSDMTIFTTIVITETITTETLREQPPGFNSGAFTTAMIELTSSAAPSETDPSATNQDGTVSYVTLRGSSLSICPSRITNPTFTPSHPLPTDYTWGCPPHQLCRPDKRTADGECNFEEGPPADTYICSPDECIPSPTLLPPQFWGRPVWSDRVGQYMVSPGYFNLRPQEFGLDFGIFLFPDHQSVSRRSAARALPGKCYDECNDAMLEAEKGKTPSLCANDSAFLTLVRACQICVNSVNITQPTTNSIPEFQQFLYYCKAQGGETRNSFLPSTTHSMALPIPNTTHSMGLPLTTQARPRSSTNISLISQIGTQSASSLIGSTPFSSRSPGGPHIAPILKAFSSFLVVLCLFGTVDNSIF